MICAFAVDVRLCVIAPDEAIPGFKNAALRIGEIALCLEAMIRKGKSPAQRLLKARILLKADVSEAGAGWSDSRIIKALETSVSMVYRVRKQLVCPGLFHPRDAHAGPCGCWRRRSWN
jgi:hypothetical protein